MSDHRDSSGAADDPEFGSIAVHLFRSGRTRAVIVERNPGRLPASEGEPWLYEGSYPLGVLHVEMPGTEPEPLIAGLAARGYYVWTVSTDETSAL